MNKQSSPAFTMAAKFHTKKLNDCPGPLTYQAKFKATKNLSPRAIIGKEKRQTFKSNQVPGPGAYDVQSISKSVGVIFSHSQQKIKRKTQLGPGDYNPTFNSVMAKYPSCKIGSEQRIKNTSKQINSTPGPLQYNPNQSITHKKPPKAIFGTSLRLNRQQFAKDTPGPGQYNNNNFINLISKTQKNIKFGKQKRQFTRSANSPGPFDYKIENQLQHNLKQKKGIIFGRKLKYLKTESQYTPAPNFYNSNKQVVWRRSPAFSLTKQSRQKQFYSTSKIPAPNNYNIESQFRKTGAIMTKSQRKSYQKSQAPGPGAYDILNQTSKNGLKYSISKCIPQNKIEKTPGPGQYNPQRAYKSQFQAISIDKGGRITTQNSFGIPGPGTYQIQSKNMTSKTMGIKIGSQKRQRFKTQMVPGPGAYTIPSYIGNVPYFQKGKK